MSDFYGGEYINEILTDDTAVAALVSTNIFNARMVPSDFNSLKTINFYATLPKSARAEFFESRWSVDCRSDVESESMNIASAVTDALNRVSSTVGSYNYFSVVDILGTIPPADNADVYNTPVQVYIRRR